MTAMIFEGVAPSVAQARAWLRRVCLLRGVHPTAVLDAVQVVSELATHVVETGGGGDTFGVEVRVIGTMLRIEVTDAGDGRRKLPPHAHPPAQTRPMGWMLMVDHFAAEWWVTIEREVTVITADVALTPLDPPRTKRERGWSWN